MMFLLREPGNPLSASPWEWVSWLFRVKRIERDEDGERERALAGGWAIRAPPWHRGEPGGQTGGNVGAEGTAILPILLVILHFLSLPFASRVPPQAQAWRAAFNRRMAKKLPTYLLRDSKFGMASLSTSVCLHTRVSAKGDRK